MPNIEIHSFRTDNFRFDNIEWKQAKFLKEQIFSLFVGEPFVGDIVVTICHGDVTLNRAGTRDSHFCALSAPLTTILTKLLKN